MTTTLIALGALLLLPGLLVVRAPWTVVPALSLAFWALSIWWPPLSGLARGPGAWSAILLVSVLLLLLRVLPKHEVPPPPGWTAPPSPEPEPRPGLPTPRLASGPALAILVVALALLAVGAALAPRAGPRHGLPDDDRRASCSGATASRSRPSRCCRSRLSARTRPPSPRSPRTSALLSGSDPARAVLLVFVAAIAAAARGPLRARGDLAPAGGRRARRALRASSSRRGSTGSRSGARARPALCLGFVLPASALVLGHVSRSSAFAAGLLFAAGLVAQPLLAVAVWASCAAVLLGRRSRRALGRLALVSGGAAGLGGPGLVPALSALSARELLAILSPSARRPGRVPRRIRRAAARRPSWPDGSPGGPGGSASALVAGLGLRRAARGRSFTSGSRARSCPSRVSRRCARLAASTGPLDVVCASPPLLDWIPALAGRAAGEPGPWIPAVYEDEWAARVRRPCRTALLGPAVTSFHRRARSHRFTGRRRNRGARRAY